MKHRSIGLRVPVWGGLLGAPAPVLARSPVDASRSAARETASAGVAAFQRNDFAIASEKLEKAYRLLKVPSFGLWSARALVKTGHLVQAAERYHEVVQLGLSEGDLTVQKQ